MKTLLKLLGQEPTFMPKDGLGVAAKKSLSFEHE
jgi:hypothetical protein